MTGASSAKPRFPLYAKVLLWFFLNGLVLLVLLMISLRVFYDVRLDRMLLQGAHERLSPVIRLMNEDLSDAPGTEWDAVLSRYRTAYGPDFFLFDGEGRQVAGPQVDLPDPIQNVLERRRAFGRRFDERRRRAQEAESPPAVQPEPPPSEEPARTDSPRPRTRRDPPEFIHRTDDPRRYWVFERVEVRRADEENRERFSLLIRSSSITGGGLWWNPTPLLLTAVVGIGLSILLWLPLVRGITRSLAQMTQASRRIATGRFDTRLSTRRRDEIGSLSQDINQMAQRLEDVVGGQKRFLGDVAHELCSPLARMQTALGILEQHTAPEQQTYLRSAEVNARHMADLVHELLSFSKASFGAAAIDTQAVAVTDIIEEAVQREAGAADIEQQVEAGLRVMADPGLLARALGNVLRNAIRYSAEAGPIRVSAAAEAEQVVIRIEDAGPGVPADELARIFDPFFRHDPSRDATTGGVGLGLTIVKTCIESCGGAVAAHNLTPHGLEVSLTLPRA